ncbi:BTB/POZ domain-containing protein 1-like [Contarinia nasturtii]|uniref:BTB/POZ domain-containing protein 1-like n=1 Tax=Contarinia nasturtii TaxID=265458 RepID=UPI0012D48CF4|nr:BTB/POZ domain-containing protein 1-like [Contarinia nasturtii]
MSSPSDDPNDIFAYIGKKLYLSTELADVHFVFKPKNEPIVRVPAHKTLLAAASNVFATMFNGSWKEKNEVLIVDVSAAVFEEFLQFFYLDRVQLTKENAGKVMNLGNMYDMGTCMTVCEKFMKRHLDEENVCEYYGLGILLDRPGLTSACEDIIGAETMAVLKSASFQNCDKKTMDAILKLDWLSCSEIELFEVMSWVKTASKKEILTKRIVQSRLGKSFQDFRFGSMTLNEYATLIPSYGKTFSFDEQQDIIQMIADEDFESKMFDGNREKRCEMDPWDMRELVECDRFRSCDEEPYFVQNLETTTFSINEAAFLSGFSTVRLYEYAHSHFYKEKYYLSANITIVRISIATDPSSDEDVVLYKEKETLYSRPSQVWLTNPIFIKPSFKYEIRLKLKPPKNCASDSLLKSKVRTDFDFILQFHGDEDDQDVSRGLISQLNFYRI